MSTFFIFLLSFYFGSVLSCLWYGIFRRYKEIQRNRIAVYSGIVAISVVWPLYSFCALVFMVGIALYHFVPAYTDTLDAAFDQIMEKLLK